MFWIGFSGLVIGFIIGMIANAYLLRDMPRENLRKNRDLRLKYGALNWGLAILGFIIAVALAKS